MGVHKKINYEAIFKEVVKGVKRKESIFKILKELKVSRGSFYLNISREQKRELEELRNLVKPTTRFGGLDSYFEVDYTILS